VYCDENDYFGMRAGRLLRINTLYYESVSYGTGLNVVVRID